MNAKQTSRLKVLAQCEFCGQRSDAAEFHAHRCGHCRSVQRWTRGVIVGCVVLLVAMFTSLANADSNMNDPWQVYADEMSGKMGLPKVALVMRHDFGSPRQRGDSLIGIKAGKHTFYVRVNPVMEKYGPHAWMNTIRHEICHLVTYTKLGRAKERGKYHGTTFRRCAEKWNVANDYVAD